MSYTILSFSRLECSNQRIVIGVTKRILASHMIITEINSDNMSNIFAYITSWQLKAWCTNIIEAWCCS